MAFVKKTWKDRIAEFPTRRRLTKSNGDSELVTVAREEGTLSQEGDAFSAENMNDLERRVDDAISEINSNLNELKTVVSNTERAIGTLDGSILYEKVYTVNTMSANTNVTLDTDFTIDSYDRLVEVTGAVTRSNGTAFQLPYFWSTSDHINIEVSSRGLLLSNISEVAVIQATVIVRYTKP